MLKFESFISNRTSDTSGNVIKPSGSNEFKVGPFEKIALPSLSQIIEGLVKHISQKVKVILDKRGNLDAQNHH